MSDAAPDAPPDTPPDDLPDAPPARRFDPRMLEALVCPQTHAPLHWDAERQELVSRSAGLAYPVRDGIPVLLTSEARAL